MIGFAGFEPEAFRPELTNYSDVLSAPHAGRADDGDPCGFHADSRVSEHNPETKKRRSPKPCFSTPKFG
jgi:hypothetical protein